MNTSSCIYSELIDLLQYYPDCVLATVVSTLGSTPQKAGSSALIGHDGLLAGTVGGGITELNVIQQSQLLLKSKKSKLLSFELHGEIAKGSESICGGSMMLLLDALPGMHLPVFAQLKNSLANGQKGVLMTLPDVSDPENMKITRNWISDGDQWPFTEELRTRIKPELSEMFSVPAYSGKLIPLKDLKTGTEGFAFAERLLPKPVLFIAGAGHIGQSLAHLGHFLGFKVTVWDDRPDYADRNFIPDADLVLSGTVDSISNQISIRDDSYLVIVTRGHKSDTNVLRRFVGSDAAYIGMIGSKAKVAQMRSAFLENNWATPEQWNRIHTPVGLDIGAQTVEEIAISIAAQLVQLRNKKITGHE